MRVALKSALFVTLAAAACAAQCGAAQDCLRDYRAAGVLPLALHGGRVLVLLGLENGRGWTDFVGGPEPQDCGPAETAAREFAEESRLAYPEHQTLRAIRRAEPVRVRGPSGIVYIWPLEVDWQDSSAIAAKPGTPHSEKVSYCWIRLGSLLAAIDSHGDATRVPEHCGPGERGLYGPFRANLRSGTRLRDRLRSYDSGTGPPP